LHPPCPINIFTSNSWGLPSICATYSIYGEHVNRKTLCVSSFDVPSGNPIYRQPLFVLLVLAGVSLSSLYAQQPFPKLNSTLSRFPCLVTYKLLRFPHRVWLPLSLLATWIKNGRRPFIRVISDRIISLRAYSFARLLLINFSMRVQRILLSSGNFFTLIFFIRICVLFEVAVNSKKYFAN